MISATRFGESFRHWLPGEFDKDVFPGIEAIDANELEILSLAYGMTPEEAIRRWHTYMLLTFFLVSVLILPPLAYYGFLYVTGTVSGLITDFHGSFFLIIVGILSFIFGCIYIGGILYVLLSTSLLIPMTLVSLCSRTYNYLVALYAANPEVAKLSFAEHSARMRRRFASTRKVRKRRR